MLRWMVYRRKTNNSLKRNEDFLNIKYFACNSGSSASFGHICVHDQLGEKKLKSDEVITCAMGFPTTISYY